MPQRAEKHDAPLLLEVERFEHVAAGAERVLLRIDGRYSDRPGKRVLDAMLFVDDGLAVHRHAPLTDGDGDIDSWLWRAAFDVPAAYLTDERTRFAIESQPGCLIDLPRPGAILRKSSAVPITARAAHIARRYAVAIAVIVTVAVTPGGMPASARTEILRVHNPDGSVVYMTRDGQTVAEMPADAVVVDQPAQPAAPQPAAPQPAVPQPAERQSDVIKPPKDATGGGISSLAAGAREQAAAQRKQTKKPAPVKQPQVRQTAPTQETQTQTQTAVPAPAPKHHKPRKPRHVQHHHTAPVHASVPQSGQALADMPALLAAPGNDDVKLQSMARVGGTAHGADTGRPNPATPPLPTEGFQTIDTLAGDAPQTPVVDDSAAPEASDGRRQHRVRDHRHAPSPQPSQPADRRPQPAAPRPVAPQPSVPVVPSAGSTVPFGSLPGPRTSVPDFVISSFRVPPFLLPIYQAAGVQYGIRWEVLAAINEIETDYGRNLNVSSAGAIGWMQFMPSTCQMYGTDANRDHKKDPYNPVDAIFAAARYLKAAGGDKDIRRAIFAYNHAGWYVDSVMLRARLIAGYPSDLIGSLTGLTEGRFPVAAGARYAAHEGERSIDIYTRKSAPVIAVNDGVVKKIGTSKTKGNYIVVQDVYGNQYTYSNLDSIAKLYPVPKADAKENAKANLPAVGAHDPKPTEAASAGAQRPGVAPKTVKTKKPAAPQPRSDAAPAAAPAPIVAIKKRFFAHPQRPAAQKHGGYEQMLDTQTGFETYDSYFSRPLGLNSRNAKLRPLKKGSRILASTVLGHVAPTRDAKGKSPHLRFEIRPAGKGAPKIDPKPILDGWKLLASTAIYRAKGMGALYGDGNFSIGEMMLLPKPLLQKRVLSDPRIDIYPGGRDDIRTGQIDRRVLVVLEYLAESGLNPTVSCLKSGHSLMTTSGNISEHSTGDAVDIAAINGVSILGHQQPGGVADEAVRRLMQLQGTMAPHQIISLLDYGQNTLSMPDHANHIHVGFRPLFGDNTKLGREAQSVLEPKQWDTLVQRLGQIDNPTVPTKPSRYALPDSKGQR